MSPEANGIIFALVVCAGVVALVIAFIWWLGQPEDEIAWDEMAREWSKPPPPKPPGAPPKGATGRSDPDAELRRIVMEQGAFLRRIGVYDPRCCACGRALQVGDRIRLSLDRQVVHQECPLADCPAPDRKQA